MALELADKEDFLRRLSNEDEVSFVFGSALTARENDVGIMDPQSIVNFIKSKVYADGYEEPYERYISDNKSVIPYQASFEFVAKSYGASKIGSIINEIIAINNNKETGKQNIPESVIQLAKAIKNEKIKVKYIITTNFDNLIEEAFDQEGVKYNSISIVQDSNINDIYNDSLTIVHIHGIWKYGDTMHTRSQLERKRGKIEESIRDIIDSGTLCIMAYGGWEDSFTRTLLTIMDNNRSNYSLIWCFFSDSAISVNDKYSWLGEDLSAAISRERVQFYKGIDCKTIFGDVNKEVTPVKK